MAITIERKPYVVVTDEQSGWSLKGGRSNGDGASTKEMSHSGGARCTVNLTDESRNNAELVLRVTGMLYLNPGENKGEYILKEPGPNDFVESKELYAVAARLIRAWYEASFTTLRPLTIQLPSR